MMVDVYTCLIRPATFHLTIKKIMVVVMVKLAIGPILATLNPKDNILGVMVQYMEVVLKISSTLTSSMLEKVFMVTVEVVIGIRPAILHPFIKATLVYYQVLIYMVVTELDIGVRPDCC